MSSQQNRKNTIEIVRDLKEQLEAPARESEAGRTRRDLAKAAELRTRIRVEARRGVAAGAGRGSAQGRRSVPADAWCRRGPAHPEAGQLLESRGRQAAAHGRTSWASGSSSRGAVRRAGCRTPGRSCSSARPVSARPSWPRRWPTSLFDVSGGRWSHRHESSTARSYKWLGDRRPARLCGTKTVS